MRAVLKGGGWVSYWREEKPGFFVSGNYLIMKQDPNEQRQNTMD
jgi:hypothetical protein